MTDGLVRVLVTVAAVALAVVTWLPWVTTGGRSRSSYEVFRSAQALGVDQLTPLRVVWFCVPVVALGVVAWLAVGRPGLAAAFLAPAALLVGGAGLVVVVAGLAAWGAWLAIVVAVDALAGVVLLVRGSRSPRSEPIAGP